MAPSDKPDPQVIAGQLRKPSGEPAAKVGDKMDQVNEPLFDLTLEAMKPTPGERILEIGFGTGTYLHRLLGDGADAGPEVYGIDYSPDMLEIASRRNSDRIDSGDLTLAIGESDNLPFEDQFFDKVYCNMVIYFWDEPERHLKEVHRVTRAGARFFTGMRTKDSMLQFPFVQYGFMLFEPEEWTELLGKHGFEVREAARRLDPVIKEEDGDIQLESVCIEAQKR